MCQSAMMKGTNMKTLKKVLKEVFIDGLSGMATGLFATLIIGTIISTIGGEINHVVGTYMVVIGQMACAMTGAGIGIGVASRLKASPLVMVSSATAGMIGAYAAKILATSVPAKNVIVNGTLVLTDTTSVTLSGKNFLFSGYGEPLGAFVAAMVCIYIGRLVSGKTKVDILITPFTCIISGAVVGLFVGTPIAKFMTWLGSIINWGTECAPFLMGIVVSVVMGIVLTLPISSAALGISLGLSGIAAGAATIGCCCNMIGFAVASYKDNKVNGLLAQGLGTSMLQIGNIVKKPVIWLPAIISSAVLGPVSTMLLKMTNLPAGSGMGTAGLVGQIYTYQDMIKTNEPVVVLIMIAVMHFILPAILSWGIATFMRKKGWISTGDMKLNV